MKTYIKIILIGIISVIFSFGIYEISKINSINLKEEGVRCDVVAKGCSDGVSIDIDKDENIYIAEKSEIQIITKDGKEKNLIRDESYNIEDIKLFEDKLYFISKDSLFYVDIQNSNIESILSKIPSGGNGIDRKLFIVNDKLCITVPSYTNSGIAEGEVSDIPPIYSVLSGNNYGDNNTGFYKKNGEPSQKGETLNKNLMGNGAIYILKDNKPELFASGIRGITGIDTDSTGKLYALFSGMRNEGLRPVNRDKDYIYKIEKGGFYGFPDYSGGDFIESPRFMGDEKLKPLLEEYIQKDIVAPLFQSEYVNSLKELAIDKDGKVFEDNTLIYWDKEEKALKTYKEGLGEKKIINVGDKSYVKDIIYNDGKFLVLDSGNGFIFSIKKSSEGIKFDLPNYILIFISVLSLSVLAVTVKKGFKIKKNKKG